MSPVRERPHGIRGVFRFVLVSLLLLVMAPVTRVSLAQTVPAYYSVDVTYDKNGCVANCGTPPYVIYKYGYVQYGQSYCCYTKSWRSGSGASGGTDPCAVNVGWIPDTAAPNPDNDYRLSHTEANGGDAVKGTAWLITNATYGGASVANCDGDPPYERTQLLIHSEMTDAHGQLCTADPDDPWCWDGTIDYYSQACIKVSFSDIHNNLNQNLGKSPSFDWYWHNRGGIAGENLYVVP